MIFVFLSLQVDGQLFQDDFGTAFASISTTNWPTACRSGSPSSFNTSVGSCAGASDYEYSMSGFGTYITTLGITIPSSGYELTFDYSFNYSLSFPTIEIRSGASCGTTLLATSTLTNTFGVCTPYSIDLSAYAGQTIYIRFKANTTSATFYFDDPTVDVSSGGGGGGCLLSDDFGTAFASISTTNWPTACRSGSPSSFNTSVGSCSGTSDYSYGMTGIVYITSMALSIPSTGYDLTFDYSYNSPFSTPSLEIRTGASCGAALVGTTNLTNTSGVCTPTTISLNAYAGQTIYIRFKSNTSSTTFYIDNVNVCGGSGGTGDYKWADNFNDNDLDLDYAGNDGDEACTGCGTWTLGGGSSLNLVPAAGWNGNTNKTEAFPSSMSNVYYVKLDRNEYIESPTIDMSGKEGFKISFYAKSSSSGTGGGDSWSSVSDHLRLQIWDGSSWITVKDITEGAAADENKISPALPFNYFCFTAYKTSTSPGNYYYTSSPNVNSAYFTSNFKFRVIFEGGFSGAPYAWVDDFTFRADADGYSTMIPCGVSFWNQPSATGYGQDPGATSLDDSERGVELELDNSISIPPVWSSQANDGDAVTQVFGVGESERVVFCVICEEEINFAFPVVNFYAPSMGWKSATMSKDNAYSGPGWKYYSVQYISCDLAGGSIAEPTDDYRYYYTFEFGNEFIPVFYHLNKSGIETGGGATSVTEVFNAPDVVSTDVCGALPVELLNFEASLKSTYVELNWQTASENNNDYFEILRSSDGINFIKIGQVDGAGNSNQILKYSFDDTSPLSGTSYYQLRQVDFNGEHSYSLIKEVDFSDAVIEIYPNPTNGVLTIANYDGNIVSIYDLAGKLIRQFNITHSSIDISTLEKGVYFIEFSDLSLTKIMKLVKE